MQRNAGVKTRNFKTAGRLLLNAEIAKKNLSFSSVASTDQAWRAFADYAYGMGVRRLEQISFELVKSYGETLAEEVLEEIYSASYAQRLVSAVNTVMHLANGSWRTVGSVADCGIAKRVAVRVQIPSGMDDAAVKAAAQEMVNKGLGEAAAVILLQKSLGLRLKEASLLDTSKALSEATAIGSITVIDGTKGGKARVVPIFRDDQFDALKQAASVQGKRTSVIPSELDWKSFNNQVLNKARLTLKAHHIEKYHDLRAAYACRRYKELTGHRAPVEVGRVIDKQLDAEARAVISQELGHHRIHVVAAYVGGVACTR